MTFIELCRRVFSEGGISGQINTVANQTGEAQRVVGWVAQAYQDILNDQAITWNFLRTQATVQLTTGKGDYTFAELNLAQGVQWDTRSMRVAVNADLSDETFLQHMRFSNFRDFWLFSSRRTVQSRPLNASVDTETKLRIAPLPDQPYWLTMEYQIQPDALLEDDDVPIFPDRFHMAIVWRALRSYGMFEAAGEVVARADTEYQTMKLALEIDQSPEVVVGDPIC